jgi:hypothetical protein
VRRSALLALALLAGGWALTLWVSPWSDETVNDLFVYRSFAEPILDGSLPYRDIAFEYPPLAAPAIVLPGIAGTGAESFRWAFALWTLAGTAALVLLCGALARATGGDPRRAMLAAALTPVACGALVRTHFDVFPVVALLAGLLLVCRDRPRAGLAVLGLGAVLKLFPLVAVPVALAWLVGRDALQGALACAAVILAVCGAAVAVSPQGAADAVRYHLDRPVQVESSPALVLDALDALGAGRVERVSSHRSDGLLHPADDAVTWLFGACLVALVALLCAAMVRREGAERMARGRDAEHAAALGHRAEHAAARALVLAALAAAAGFALFGKVLSPQFVIWALPLGALAFAWRMHALAGAVLVAALLTQLEFPAHYFDVVAREPLWLVVVALRNLALLAVLVLSVRELLPRGQKQLLDRGGAPVAVGVD